MWLRNSLIEAKRNVPCGSSASMEPSTYSVYPMPSTTPDLRMAAARGFSRSPRLGGGAWASRGGATGFVSAGSAIVGAFGNFASAGHMASKLALGSGRAGGGTAAGAGGAGDRQPASRFLSVTPDPTGTGAAGGD